MSQDESNNALMNAADRLAEKAFQDGIGPESVDDKGAANGKVTREHDSFIEKSPRCSYCGNAFEDVDPADFTLREGKWWCGCEEGEGAANAL